MATTTSLLHTALQNLHVAQQVAHPSHTPRPASSVDSGRSSRAGSRMASDDEDDELVTVGKGTAPGTPIPGKGQVLGQRIKNASNDPVSVFSACFHILSPSHRDQEMGGDTP
jgi:hypothetical protein